MRGFQAPQKFLRLAIVSLVALFLVTPGGAFVRDTHYGLTFASVLTTCFSWDEAHLIASADFMVGQNKSTKAEPNPFARRAKVNWHAFNHSGERYIELWNRVLQEKDLDSQLIKFGQFLHFLQDWESHAGFGSSLGHAKATVTGHDPDSLARSVPRTQSTVQSTLDHLARLCAHLGRLPDGIDDPDEVLLDYHEDFIGDRIVLDLASAPEGTGGRPPVKAYECFPPRDFCPALVGRETPPSLRIQAETGAVANEVLVPLEGSLGGNARRSCDRATTEGYADSTDPVGEDPVGLRVLTFNVWHGLRSGESKTKFPGEDEGRKERRFAWQIRLIQELDPDVLFLQEVNPNQREARLYAQALRYNEIHKVTSCGIHIPPIKIPKNVNEGLAILARPGLDLRRVQTKRLSGNATCTASFGFQTKESRYVLLGEITVDGNKILLATTHLSSPPYVPPGFEEGVAALLSQGVLTEAQYGEIVGILDSKRERNLAETRKLLLQVDKHRKKLSPMGRRVPVILTGDFNTEPDTASIDAITSSALRNVATGPDYLTWDPVRNAENHEIGSRRSSPLPTFDLEEIEELLAPRETTARQIDYIFVSEEGRVVSSRIAMDEPRHGMYPSDHFGIFAVIDFDFDPPELDLARAREVE